MKGIVAGAMAATLALASAAEAQPSVQPSRSVQMPRKPTLECSVTAGGPAFAFGRNVIDMSYGGGVSCRGGVGFKVLKVRVQVAGSGPNRGRFFDVSGSQRTTTGSGNPVRVNTSRQAFLGHGYRVVAQGSATIPNGFAGCSLHKPPACNEVTFATVIGPTIAP